MLNGRAREMGLGPLHTVSLAEARARAASNASMGSTQSKRGKPSASAHRPAWRNAKHASQRENPVKTYADPLFGWMPVQLVGTNLVMKVIEPL
jgi:hypothetical protein